MLDGYCLPIYLTLFDPEGLTLADRSPSLDLGIMKARNVQAFHGSNNIPDSLPVRHERTLETEIGRLQALNGVICRP
jgi:hypothetical protein